MTPTESAAEIPQPRIRPAGNVASFLALAVAGWGWFAFWGPYRWLAELQQSLLGAYYPALTFLFTLLALIIPWVLLRAGLERAGLRAGAASTPSPRAAALVGLVQWHERALAVGALGVVFAVLGARDWRAATSDPEVRDLAALEQGRASWPALPVLDGRLLEESGVEFGTSRYGAEQLHRYVPLVSPEWSPEAPIVAFVVDPPEDEPLLRGVHARVIEQPAPGPVRAALEDAGARVSATAVVLSVQPFDRDATGRFGRWMASAGVLLALVGAGLGVWQVRKERRAAVP